MSSTDIGDTTFLVAVAVSGEPRGRDATSRTYQNQAIRT
jgi:hypothetical protein